MTVVQKIRVTFLRISGYLVPLVQQIPTLGFYTGLMTLPLLTLFVILFTQFPWSIIGAISEFLLMSLISVSVFIANLVTILGLLLALYSIIYFWRHKRDGLITTGPYRYSRHPQYAGFLLMTLGFTAYCYWWLSNTYGMGWLSKEATVALWFIQLGIYVALALIEESYLTKEFGDQYTAYSKQASFLVPLGRFNRFDIALSIGIFCLAMLFVILFQSVG